MNSLTAKPFDAFGYVNDRLFICDFTRDEHRIHARKKKQIIIYSYLDFLFL